MLRSLWISMRGYWFRPWRSPYLRWRIETYSGIPAESITARVFFGFLWREKRALLHHLFWMRQMSRMMSPAY